MRESDNEINGGRGGWRAKLAQLTDKIFRRCADYVAGFEFEDDADFDSGARTGLVRVPIFSTVTETTLPGLRKTGGVR